jgi:hypothetical protein
VGKERTDRWHVKGYRPSQVHHHTRPQTYNQRSHIPSARDSRPKRELPTPSWGARLLLGRRHGTHHRGSRDRSAFTGHLKHTQNCACLKEEPERATPDGSEGVRASWKWMTWLGLDGHLARRSLRHNQQELLGSRGGDRGSAEDSKRAGALATDRESRQRCGQKRGRQPKTLPSDAVTPDLRHTLTATSGAHASRTSSVATNLRNASLVK